MIFANDFCTLLSICDKIKPVHTKCLEFIKTEKQQLDVLFLSSQIVPVESSQDTRENMRIK